MLYLSWADTEGLRPALLPTLSKYRAEKLRALKDADAARNSLAVELLLIRSVLMADPKTTLPLEIEANENGKPFLADRNYSFSLSHSGHFAACALGDFELGLDIQTRVSCRENLVKRFFAPDEQDMVFSAKDADEAFSRLWCRKESFLKAIGLGLRLELDSFNLTGDRPVIRYRDIDYAFREFRNDELYFCLCAPRERMPETVSFEKQVLI